LRTRQLLFVPERERIRGCGTGALGPLPRVLACMKVLIQRVRRGSVTVEGRALGSVGIGFVALVGVRPGDSETDARHLARRTLNLRVFPDDAGKMNRSLLDAGGAVLAISQFTLYADTRKGNRPSFIGAAEPALAAAVYEAYVSALRAELGPERVACGRFGAEMLVEILNDGPVTIELSTDGRPAPAS
jgi:D-tyrosyl-tRNA(Tyr) deacylase